MADTPIAPMPEEFDNFITLTDENGRELRFELVDLIKFRGEDYVVLLSDEDADNKTSEDDADEVAILRVESDPDEEIENYVSVEDEVVLSAVYAIFKERYRNEFHFAD